MVIGMTRRFIAAGALALLLLTGCSAQTSEQAEVPDTSSSAAVETPTASETPEALTAESAAPVADSEAAYLERVRAELRPENVIPNATDEQLLAAGREACERRAAGEASDTISVIDGEPQSALGLYVDSGTIITAARNTLCAS